MTPIFEKCLGWVELSPHFLKKFCTVFHPGLLQQGGRRKAVEAPTTAGAKKKRRRRKALFLVHRNK